MNEVDRKIARLVFGLDTDLVVGGLMVLPRFSSDIAEAFKVVDLVHKKGGKVLVETWPNGYAAMASRDWKTAPMHWARGDDAAQAICAAVLKAYGEA